MVVKEIIEARWKVLIGAALGVLMIGASAFVFQVMQQALSKGQVDQVANIFGSDFAMRRNNGIVVLIVAALIGASFVAGEVSKGTIYLLLSRPLTRERILLTKYAVGAVLLLGMNLLGGIVLYVAAAIAGHPQDMGGVAVSVLLFWLASLFILGISTLFSVIFNDVLRPVAVTVVLVILLSLPALIPGGSEWVLPGYWSNLPAFLGQEFPLKAVLVSLVAAAVPLLVAVPLFRQQEY
jgi:ABC-type transport system involved in multi-copper enzyme maturation permease subunit